MNLRSTILSTVVVLFLTTAMVFAQTDGTNTASMGLTVQNMPSLAYSYIVQGDYVAAGVGMRNKGYGTINLAIPSGATIHRAFLYWAIMYDNAAPAGTGIFNGNAITGTAIGTSVDPCWSAASSIRAFYADVTAYTVSGANSLTNFESGVTDGTYPWSLTTLPLLEGASLVIIFEHPQYDYNHVKIYEGCETFWGDTRNLSMGPIRAWTSGFPADETAHTSYIFSDGQVTGGTGDIAAYNSTNLLGPTPDAFPGNDGYLWDTYNHNVSSMYPNGVLTPADASVTAAGDCITWITQVVSYKHTLFVPIDIKAGSCPNPFNVKTGGKLPVAILGTSHFDVTDIDVSTITSYGYSTVGNEYLLDVATPHYSLGLACNDCGTGLADGYLDLNVRFNRKDLASYISYAPNGACIGMLVSGELFDGTPWIGWDVIKVIKPGSSPKETSDNPQSLVLDLASNHPNPVTSFTVIRYTVPEAQSMHLAVYNALGQEVAVLHSGMQSAGQHQVRWDGVNHAGVRVSPGVYYYKLHAGDQVLAQKLLMTR